MIHPLMLIDLSRELKNESKIASNGKLDEFVIEAIKRTTMSPEDGSYEGKHSLDFTIELGDVISQIVGTSADDVVDNIIIGNVAYDSHEYMIGCLAEKTDIVKKIDARELEINDESLAEYCTRLARSIHSERCAMCLVDNKDYLHFIFLNSELMLASMGDKETEDRLRKFKERSNIHIGYVIVVFIYENKDEITKARQVMRDSIEEYLKDILFSSPFNALLYVFNRFRKSNPTRKDDMITIFAAVDVISPIFDKKKMQDAIKKIVTNNIFDVRNN